MKTRKILLVLTSALTAFFAPSVLAMDKVGSTDGVYVSGGVSSTTLEFNQSRNTQSNQPNTGATGGPSGTVVDKDTGIGFVGALGYKTHLADEFYVAAEGFYSSESADVTTLNNVLSNHVELQSSYGGNVHIGFDVTDKFSVYGLIGATAYDFDSSLSYTFAPPKDMVSETEWALSTGGGTSFKVNEKFSIFAEARVSNDVSFETPKDKGGVISKNELNFFAIKSGVRYHF